MILDKENLLSEDQAITATAASTNVIDLGVDRDIGKGIPVPVLIQVTADFASLTDLTATIETATDEAFSSPETLATSGAVPVADLKAGYQFPIQYLPLGTKRYVRVNYTVGGVNATAGTVTAGIVASHQHGH